MVLAPNPFLLFSFCLVQNWGWGKNMAYGFVVKISSLSKGITTKTISEKFNRKIKIGINWGLMVIY